MKKSRLVKCAKLYRRRVTCFLYLHSNQDTYQKIDMKMCSCI